MKAKTLGLVLAALALGEAAAYAADITKWETLEPDEDQVNRDIVTELTGQIQRNYADKGKRSFRDTHSRAVGCVQAKFTVNSDLPKEYQAGVFARPGQSYDALIRFSNSRGPDGDNVKDARGLAMKLFGVPGKKLLEGQEDATTQDYIFNDFDAFPTRNAWIFFGTLKLQGDPSKAQAFIQENPIENTLALKTIIGSSAGNPYNGTTLLSRRYDSNTPYLFKSSSIELPSKFAMKPCGTVAAKPLNGTATELRDDLQERLNNGEACFDFYMQFYKEGVGFSVEDGRSVWSEKDSPLIKFAQVKLLKQKFVTDEKLAYCDSLSFQPWHTIAEHRPLGNINRSRKYVYEGISRFRHANNGETELYKEPVDISTWNSFKSDTYSVWKDVLIPAKP